MTLNHPRSGGSFVPEFQVAPAPYLTQSSIPAGGANVVVGHAFPTLATCFQITNHDSGSLRVGFSRLGVNGTNYYQVVTSASLSIDCRFTSLFIRGNTGQNYSLFVGLTGIQQKDVAEITGSNGYTVG